MRRNGAGRTRRLVLVVVSLAWIAGCGIDPEVELDEAQADFEAGDLRAALIRVSNVLQADSDNTDAMVLRGRIALAAGSASEARERLQHARSVGAAGPGVIVPLADALIQTGAGGEALELLDELPPQARGGEYWLLRAEALTRADRLDEASAALRQSRDVGGETSRQLIAEARLAEAGQEPQAAEALYSRAVDITLPASDERARALAARGDFFLRLEREQAGVADLQAAADLFSGFPGQSRQAPILITLIQIHLANNELDAATARAAQLADAAPDTLATRYFEALLAFQRGQVDDALTALQQIVRRAPDEPRFRTLLGAAHLAMGNVFQAEQQFSAALNLAPDDPATIKLLAETRIRQRRPEAALDSLRPLANLSTDPQLSALQGIASLQSGEVDEAVAHLEQAVSASSGDKAFQFALARAYLAAGRNEDAGRLLEQLSAIDADLGVDMMLLLSRLQSGDLEVAREDQDLVARFPEDARAYEAAAAIYELGGERQMAIGMLREAARLDPGLASVRIVLADLLIAEGRAGEAEQLLREVLTGAPRNAAALAGLAQLAVSRGELDSAASLLGDAVSSDPAVALRLALARVHLRRGDVPAARVQVDASADAAPDHPEVVAVRGLLSLESGAAEEAVALLEAARSELPARLDIALALAQARIVTGDLEGGKSTLQQAARLAPDSLQIRRALGAVDLRLGDIGSALTIAKALQVDFPRQPAGYLLEADARIAERRYGSAAVGLSLAYERMPSWDLLAYLAMAYELAGEPQRIESELRAWVADHPDHVPSRLSLAGLLEQSGRREEALGEYERIVALDPSNLIALNNAAWLHHEFGNDGAVALAERAYALAPRNPAVLDTLGWILVERGRGSEGLAYLEQAAGLAPEAHDIQYHLGAALAGLGRNEEARDVLTRLLDRAAQFPARADAVALRDSL